MGKKLDEVQAFCKELEDVVGKASIITLDKGNADVFNAYLEGIRIGAFTVRHAIIGGYTRPGDAAIAMDALFEVLTGGRDA